MILPHCLVGNDDDDRFEVFIRQFKHQHARDYVDFDNLITGSGGGFSEARNILNSEEELKLLKERLYLEECNAREKARKLEIECQKRNGTYVEPPPYRDDGTC